MPTAVFKSSNKENERRIPIHPDHIVNIPPEVLSELIFEKDYAIDYGFEDSVLESMGCKFADISELFSLCGVLILPKPTVEDLLLMKSGQALCGWNHAVQQTAITNVAIQSKLTLISWENMNQEEGAKKLHVFYRNNEIAGYSAVIHYLQLQGLDGYYGEKKKAVIFGHGSVSRGAIYALQGRGYTDITVYTKRKTHLVSDKIPGVEYKNFYTKDYRFDMASADFVINGVLQDVNKPMMFSGGLGEFKKGAGIIDISCDEGMGFPFAKPTTFENPIIKLGRGINYYSVDHTPSYLWNAASREISKSLLPYLEYIIDKNKWETSAVIKNAIDVLDGEIINQNIKFKQEYEQLSNIL